HGDEQTKRAYGQSVRYRYAPANKCGYIPCDNDAENANKQNKRWRVIRAGRTGTKRTSQCVRSNHNGQARQDCQSSSYHIFLLYTRHTVVALRPKLRHAGPNDVSREAELRALSRVDCSDLLNEA